jgi:hypothetical protein
MPFKDPEARKAYQKKWQKANRETVAAKDKAYRETNRETINAWRRDHMQTPQGRKAHKWSSWKSRGLVWQDEAEFDRIYELWRTQELCNACDCVLTRGDGHVTSTTACMDHCHKTHLFRHIICQSCNSRDSWMKYFC